MSRKYFETNQSCVPIIYAICILADAPIKIHMNEPFLYIDILQTQMHATQYVGCKLFFIVYVIWREVDSTI